MDKYRRLGKPITSWDSVPIVMDLIMAARIVGQNPDYLKQRSIAGTFPAYKEGNQWRVTKDALIKHIENNSVIKKTNCDKDQSA